MLETKFRALCRAAVAMRGELRDEEALIIPELYAEYEALVARLAVVERGYRFRYGGRLWKTLQLSTTFNGLYAPGAGTESLYAEVAAPEQGAKEDPIPYNGNMILEEGRFYTQAGVLYRCIRGSGTEVFHPLAELVGLYVEVV